MFATFDRLQIMRKKLNTIKDYKYYISDTKIDKYLIVTPSLYRQIIATKGPKLF